MDKSFQLDSFFFTMILTFLSYMFRALVAVLCRNASSSIILALQLQYLYIPSPDRIE